MLLAISKVDTPILTVIVPKEDPLCGIARSWIACLSLSPNIKTLFGDMPGRMHTNSSPQYVAANSFVD